VSPLSPTFFVTQIAGQPEAEFVRIVADLIALAEERDRLMVRRSQLVDELVALARRNDLRSDGRTEPAGERASLNRQVDRDGPHAELADLWRLDRLTAALGDSARSSNGNAPGNERFAGDPGS
jgi:hypothetical protein